MSVLNAIPLLLLELELSLQRLTIIAQTGPPPAIMTSIYEHGKRSVDILEARATKKRAILEALAENHEVMEYAAKNKNRAHFGAPSTHRKRAREDVVVHLDRAEAHVARGVEEHVGHGENAQVGVDLFCNETI